MQNLEIIHKILNQLTHWRVYTELSSAARLNDVNNTNEELCVLILNKVYGWNLKNLNTSHTNYPAIDLGDTAKGIGVSVTATDTSTYIKEKIGINIKHKVYETYPIHYFLITTRKKDYTAIFDTEGKYTFDKSKHIIDFEDLLAQIKGLPINIQEEILSILESHVSKLKGKLIDDITPQDIAKLLNGFLTKNPSLIGSISKRIKDIHRTDFPLKNKINNLSEGYIKLIQQQSLPFFEQFRVFLESFENKDLKNIYYNITADLQKEILTNRKNYALFDDIFEAIEDTCNVKNPELVSDRRALRILLHFMYFQCDIGENKK